MKNYLKIDRADSVRFYFLLMVVVRWRSPSAVGVLRLHMPRHKSMMTVADDSFGLGFVETKAAFLLQGIYPFGSRQNPKMETDNR